MTARHCLLTFTLLLAVVLSGCGQSPEDELAAKYKANIPLAFAAVQKADEAERKNPLKHDYVGAYQLLSDVSPLPEPFRSQYQHLKDAYLILHWSQKAVDNAEADAKRRMRKPTDDIPQCMEPEQSTMTQFGEPLGSVCLTNYYARENYSRLGAWWGITGKVEALNFGLRMP